MKNLIKARIAPLFRFTACAALIVCGIAVLSLTGCDLDKLIEVISNDSTETNPFELTVGENWKEGTLSFYWSSAWYRFPVTDGTTYLVYQNDAYTGDGTKEANIMVSAKYEGEDHYINGFGDEYFGINSSPHIFVATKSQNALLHVQGASFLAGSYAIKVVEVVINNSDPTVTLNTVTSNGNATTTTSQLTLSFSGTQFTPSLTAADISLDGVPGVVKGNTLGGSWPTYTLTIHGFNSSGTVSVSVFKQGYNIQGAPKTAFIHHYVASGASTQQGLYTGIIGFNDVLTVKELTLLNTGSKNDFTTTINNLAMRRNSGLYYAVDNAITRLENATLPNDLVNVSIVTFTDGFDNASIALNREYNTIDAYRTAVSNRLGGQIKNVDISAYSIGIRGNDVTSTNEAAFRNDLEALASSTENAKLVDNMNEVNSTFVTIANSLYRESQSSTLTFTIPGGLENGATVYFTFDSAATATASTLYIKGDFSHTNGTYSLSNVQYVGMSGDDTTVTGQAGTGADVNFTFNVKSNLSDIKNNVKFWRPVNSVLQEDSEFDGNSVTVTNVVKKSAVVILVLDCTSSLGDAGFAAMKNAANGFINTLVTAQTP